ncbi:Transcriptional regulator [Flavobacterium longum]|uniref:hypothetical protein n=1 Tax=Flavobacterium longum TaxID=1299340 RepID=UPI0039ED023F
MDSFILDENIPIMYVTAQRFPEGIEAAFDILYNTVPQKEERRYFGVSRPENGTIVYRAAAEILGNEDAASFGLASMVIKGGSYNTYYIKDYRENTQAIGDCFQLLLGQAEVDPDGFCVEWYIGEDDVKCMVRCNDQDYPVDN